VNPENYTVAAILDKARAEFKAGDRAGGRAAQAYAEQAQAAYLDARQAEPMGELPSVGGSTPDEADPEAGPEAEPAARRCSLARSAVVSCKQPS